MLLEHTKTVISHQGNSLLDCQLCQIEAILVCLKLDLAYEIRNGGFVNVQVTEKNPVK